MNVHAFFSKDKLNGLFTQFSEAGDECVQIEYVNGEPMEDSYTISSKDGNVSKFRLSDNTPIWDLPTYEDKKTDYKNGEAWPYYQMNGFILATTNTHVKEYGKYYKIPIIFANNSMQPIELNPKKIYSTLTDKKGNSISLHVYTFDEYIRIVKNHQQLKKMIASIGEGLAAVSAGHSMSTTISSSNLEGQSFSYGSISAQGSGGYAYGSYSGYNYHNGVSTTVSTTYTYDGAAAFQARMIARERVAAYKEALLEEMDAIEHGYLKRTTVHPGETISGYVLIQRINGVSMDVTIYINGIPYSFPWTITK